MRIPPFVIDSMIFWLVFAFGGTIQFTIIFDGYKGDILKMEHVEKNNTKRCVFCGKRVSIDAFECNFCGNIIQDLAPKYAPGKEPENIRAYLQSLFGELNEKYPDCNIDFSTWNHERWDKAAVAMQKHLGYQNGGAFLKSYGYSIGKVATTNRPAYEREPSDSKQTQSKVSHTARKSVIVKKGVSKSLLSVIAVVNASVSILQKVSVS